MKRFTELLAELDSETSVNAKVNALASYFRDAGDADVLWAIALFSGRRPKRTVSSGQLRSWAAEASGLPLWLFEECYHVVGDLAETIAAVLPSPVKSADISLNDAMLLLRHIQQETEEQRKEHILDIWQSIPAGQRFTFNKLLTGGFRMGVSAGLIVKALSKHSGIDANLLSHRLMGNWDPYTCRLQELLYAENENDQLSRPYPFYLAYALEDTAQEPEPAGEWQVEYKWDGIRGQIIRRNGHSFIWTRGEELVNDKYPELMQLAAALPDGTVLDGEIVAFKDGMVQAFQLLQKRIGRKNLSAKLLGDIPVAYIAYDQLEHQGSDIRGLPLQQRRQILEKTIGTTAPHSVYLLLSEVAEVRNWADIQALRDNCRSIQAEGLMLKWKNGSYKTGRKRGEWWKWKLDPMQADAVMIYAQSGHGRRASLYTDLTFAVWDGDRLVPFAKAYSGLTDAELKTVDAFIKQNTIEKFGPVRSVKAEMVFEIAFEGISLSTRHKSGIAVRFPRIVRIRGDKTAAEANTLDDLRRLIT